MRRSIHKKELQGHVRRTITSIYKTTNMSNEDNGTHILEYETQLCELTDLCLDLSWSGKIPKDFYYDLSHPKEPVYRHFNIRLLEMLQTSQI